MPEPVFEFDVFISYSSHDKEWVRGELLQRIEQAGLKACIDFRDFSRGAPGIREMERAVVECPKTLLVLTPNYVKSAWAAIENIMVQTLDPDNRSLRLIPLLKVKCEKPLSIGALTHIDFTDGADHALAWRQLLTALGAPPEPPAPKQPERDDWFLAHPYPMPPNFTGRVAERRMLSGWLEADGGHPLLVLRALGGFGKSALAWHWLLHDVSPGGWPRVLWWSFYETDTSFDSFLLNAVAYLSGGRIDPKRLSAREAIIEVLRLLHARGTLLVLDGFERELRAFGGLNAAYQGDEASKAETNERDCISPLGEAFLRHVSTLPNIRSKILITTRLRPRAVEAHGNTLLQGCCERELRQMELNDAVEFFRAQGIRGTRTEIEAACEPYGCHPLSLRLVAGLVVSDLRRPGDIAAARRLDVSGDLVQRQHHVLEASYNALTPARQTLLGRIACFRSPVRYEALQTFAESDSVDDLDATIKDLVSRGLLHHDTKEGRFDLHPIVRRYAYDRLAAPDRAAAHTRLRDYFALIPEPEKVTCLEDLAPVIELYHHTVCAGQLDEAVRLFCDRIESGTYFHLGAYLLRIDLLRALFPDGENRLPRLKTEEARSWTLNALSASYYQSGQSRRAIALLEIKIAIDENCGDKKNLAVGLQNLASAQGTVGAFGAAEEELRRSIALCSGIGDEFSWAVGKQELALCLTYRGAWAESETELRAAMDIFEGEKALQSQGVAFSYRALLNLLHSRTASDSVALLATFALESAQRALELADENARTQYPYERDYIRAHWLLGAAHRVGGQLDEAERHLHEALERCRRVNLVETEADILVDFARLRVALNAPEEAARLAAEALAIAERCQYVMPGADAHLELAKLALARGDRAAVHYHATEARRLATCDGPPDFIYKVAYDEAGALLASLGRG